MNFNVVCSMKSGLLLWVVVQNPFDVMIVTDNLIMQGHGDTLAVVSEPGA